jgi:hypothetical protein
MFTQEASPAGQNPQKLPLQAGPHVPKARPSTILLSVQHNINTRLQFSNAWHDAFVSSQLHKPHCQLIASVLSTRYMTHPHLQHPNLNVPILKVSTSLSLVV